jgi:hypothetical protein
MAGGGGGGTVNTEAGPAQVQLAAIGRDMFADWKNRYQPMTAALAGQVKNPAYLARDLANASKTIGGQFMEQQRGMQQGLARMGVEPTQEQMATVGRQSALAQAGLDAAARRNVRRATFERGSAIITGV